MDPIKGSAVFHSSGKPKRRTDTRRCGLCGSRLNQYNLSQFCNVHREATGARGMTGRKRR